MSKMKGFLKSAVDFTIATVNFILALVAAIIGAIFLILYYAFIDAIPFSIILLTIIIFIVFR